MQPRDGGEQGAAKRLVRTECRSLRVGYRGGPVEQASSVGKDGLWQGKDGEGRGHRHDAVEGAQIGGQILVAVLGLQYQLGQALDCVRGMLGEVLRQCAPDGRVEGGCGGRECIRLWRSEDGDRRWSRGRCRRRILFVDGRILAGSCGGLLLWLGCCGRVCAGGGAGVDRRLGEFVNYLRPSALWTLAGTSGDGAVSPHRGVPRCTAVSPATRHCQRGLAMLVAAAAEGTHESSEPSSAAFCSTVCAASGQQSASQVKPAMRAGAAGLRPSLTGSHYAGARGRSLLVVGARRVD